jgi:hypothetical protein
LAALLLAALLLAALLWAVHCLPILLAFLLAAGP